MEDSCSISTDDMARARRRAKASSKALHACLAVLVKPRIWAGRNTVVNACARITSQWTSIGSDEEILGWEGSPGQCPWRPVLLSASQMAVIPIYLEMDGFRPLI